MLLVNSRDNRPEGRSVERCDGRVAVLLRPTQRLHAAADPAHTSRVELGSRRTAMKVVECAKVDPSSGCNAVIRGKDEMEVMKKAAEHAKQHGIRDVTPEMQAKVRASVHDE